VRRHPGYWVVAGWGALNGLLLAVLGVYGESTLVFWLWGGAVAVLEVAALAVLASSRRGPEQHTRYRVPRGGGGAVLVAALGTVLAGLGFVYGWWLLGVALPALGLAAGLAARGTRTPEGG
jgi:hypothetical protein